MNILRFVTAALILVCGWAPSLSSHAAQQYSGVYVFGDSLSDIGRDAALLGGYPGPAFGYAAGRFSNGPVAVEGLTQALSGSALTIGHDYAYGGALTGVSPFTGVDNNIFGLNGTGLQNQVALFHGDVGAGHADPNALYVVWAGSNDFAQLNVLLNSDGQQWNRVIGNLQTAITNLAADGARHFLVPNLGNLGLEPAVLANGSAAATAASQFSAQFDATLAQSLTAFDTANAGFDVKQFDLYGLMSNVASQVAANGSFMGITNMATPCLTDPVCFASPALASQAFFWDDVHFSAQAHAIVANAFLAAIPAVPELGSGLLMLAGLVAVGRCVRRRGA